MSERAPASQSADPILPFWDCQVLLPLHRLTLFGSYGKISELTIRKLLMFKEQHIKDLQRIIKSC